MFLITLDPHYYDRKPENFISAITNRLKQAGGTLCDEAQLYEHVQRGGTFVPGVFTPQKAGVSGWGDFVQQQIIAIDFDNKGNAKNEQGAVTACNLSKGYLDPIAALDRCETLGLTPMLLYFTFSCTLEHLRYRIVFDLGQPIKNENAAREAILTLCRLFPECDRACKNTSRLFFGSNGEVWPCYLTWTKGKDNIEVLRYWHYKFTVEAAAETEKHTKAAAATLSKPKNNLRSITPRHGGNDELKAMCAQLDLLNLVQQDTGEPGVRNGNYVKFNKCPLCNHRNNLVVWPADNRYACFSDNCPWPAAKDRYGRVLDYHGGNVLDYLQYARHSGMLTEAVRELRLLTGNTYPTKKK